jgi:hypothetical protein
MKGARASSALNMHNIKPIVEFKPGNIFEKYE